MSDKGRFLCLCAVLFIGAGGGWAVGQEAIPLDQAVKDGRVDAEVSGIGGSTGDAILIAVRRKVPGVLRLTLTPGMVFKSVAGTVQNMAGASIKGERFGENSYRPAAEIVLTDDARHSYVVEAYCLDFHKANPGLRDSFALTAPDRQAARILSAGRRKSASIGAIQAALWMAREGLSLAQVRERFPLTPQDIEEARAIISEVTQEVNQQVRRQPEPTVAVDAQPTIRPGDTVVVANDGAKLMAGDTVIAVLTRGTQVRVAKVSGRWVAVSAVVKGASTIGWVGITDVRPVFNKATPKQSSTSRALARVGGGTLAPVGEWNFTVTADATFVGTGGGHLTGEGRFQTEVGTLTEACLIEEATQISMVPGAMQIVDGFANVSSRECIMLGDEIELHTGLSTERVSSKPQITFVQEKKTGKWLGTNGRIRLRKGSPKLVEGHAVNIVGGTEHPVLIDGKPYANTTLVVTNGKMVLQEPPVKYCIFDDLPLREQPAAPAKHVLQLKALEKVQVIHSANDWSYVRLNGSTGWVHRLALIDSRAEAERIATLRPTPNSLIVLSDFTAPGTFQVELLHGRLYLPRAGATMSLKPGNCISISKSKGSYRGPYSPFERAIESPQFGVLYWVNDQDRLVPLSPP